MAVARGETVLVVEDDPYNRRLMARILAQEGFQVEEAQNGAEAIRALARPRSPSDGLCLMLLDLTLPQVNGFDVLRHCGQEESHVPVVVVSADHENLEAAVAAGAQATLEKPFDLENLLQVVDGCCLH